LGAATQAKLKVYASGHSCEEFWYMSAQTHEAAGGCGGGSYRELLVFIDGLLAGAALPFPVIYTGGINPYLWRPLTGIRSFDIPAYEFDLTPFLYNLTDGQPHQLEVKAYHNDVPTGKWYVNPVLVLYHQSAAVIEGGNVTVTGSALPVVDQRTRHLSNPTSYTQTYTASHEYRVEGYLKFASGDVVTSSTFGHLQARSEIQMCHNAAGVIDSKQVSRRGSQRGSHQIEVVDEYPFHVFLAYRLTPQLYSIHASADYARESFVQYSRRRYTLNLSNHLVSSAVYDQALDNSRIITVALGEALQNNRIDVQGEQCFKKRQKAKNGIIEANEDDGQCSWSEGLYVCGGSVCGEMGGPPFSV